MVIKKKKKKKDVPALILPCLETWGQKDLAELKIFNLSEESDAHYCVVRKPLNKEGKKPRTKVLKTQCPVTPCVLQQTQTSVYLSEEAEC